MNTPINDFLEKYAASDVLRCHMPGHKGTLCRYDITEINGADSLFEADGIILESEKNMSSLYGTEASFFSASGSTLCIQAMLMAMKQEDRKIIAVRNVHRSFINAAALLGLEVEWILPDYTHGILSGEIDLTEVEEKIKSNENSCLYVTSPDYTGKIADIRSLSEICHRYGATLLVDNAHGAHLHFFPESMHPIALGADICCDSAHKMLPALTGAAVLHTSVKRYAQNLRQYMSIFASTSPSYLVLASLDLCCKYIKEEILGDMAENLFLIYKLKENSGGLVTTGDDPFHVIINASEYMFSGNEFAANLRRHAIECEYSDENIVILLMSPKNRKEDYEKLSDGIKKAAAECARVSVRPSVFLKKLPEKAVDIRAAVFAPCEEIPVEQAEGRICASVKVPCPPAIPIAVSGEIIDGSCIELYRHYGIKKVMVIK